MKIKVTATYDEDSRRYHRFLIRPQKGVTGSVYIEKGKEIPKTVIIHLKTQANEKEEKGALKKANLPGG